LVKAVEVIAIYLDKFRPAGSTRHKCQFPQWQLECLGEGLEGGFGGTSVHGRSLNGNHQGVVAISAADPGSASSGLHPDGKPNGYTRRKTATTLPRIDASFPSIGS